MLSSDAAPAVHADAPVAFLEAVARFLRTIPLYPPGHVRVAAATERLVSVLHEAPGSTVVEVTPGGLLVRGDDAGDLGPGPAAFRTALLQTAVSRVTFEPDARPEAYVEFSRALQRNIRRAGHGQVTFSDLWTTPIPGIEVEELRFRREGFGGGEGAEPGEAHAVSYAEALAAGEGQVEGDPGEDARGAGGSTGTGAVAGSSGDAGDGARAGAGSDGGAGARGGAGSDEGMAPGSPAPSSAPSPSSSSPASSEERGAGRSGSGSAVGGGSGPHLSPVSSAVPVLRALLQDDAEIRGLLLRAENALETTPSAALGRLPAGSDADFLEHLLRLLPIETRSDPRRAREAVRRVLERFLEEIGQMRSAREHRPQAAVLMQALWSIFPRRRDAPREAAPPSTEPQPPAKQDPEDGDLAFLDELGAAFDEPDRMVTLATAFAPDLVPDDGILDLASILTHAWLAEPVPERRDVLAQRVVDALRARPEDAPRTCLRSHMDQAAAVPLPRTDLDCLERLARVAELAALDRTPAFRGWLPEDVVVASFPRLLRAHLRAGGSASSVLWRVGRSQVLAARVALFDAKEGLGTGLLDSVLSLHGEEAFWLIEALLTGDDPALHVRAQRALRGRDLPSIAAVAFRAAPPASVPTSFLRILAQDGAAGVDSHRLDVEAVALLRRCIEDRTLPMPSRVYAVASLSAFGMETAQPVLRELLRRRFGVIPRMPREVRRQAGAMLKGRGLVLGPPAHVLVPIVEEGL